MRNGRMAGSVLFLLLAFSVRGSIITPAISARKLSVGDPLHYTVKLLVAKGSMVTPPSPDTDFGTLAVKEWNLQKLEREKSDSLIYDYVITTYIPEPCTLPELRFLVEHRDGVDTLTTDPIPLQIISVVTGDTADLIGLKPPLTAGRPPKWWLWLSGGAIGLTGLLLGLSYVSRKLRKIPPPPPPVPPYEEAIDALRDLSAKKYLRRGLVREHVFELSEIFKRYIGRRFECNASEFTSEEMTAWAGASALGKKQRGTIEWFFRATDPVKFARMIPDSGTVDRFDLEVRDFLESTKPVREPESPIEDPAPPPSAENSMCAGAESSGKNIDPERERKTGP